MKLSSLEFDHEGSISKNFTCDGEDVSPALIIEDISEETKKLTLIVDDPDAPMETWSIGKFFLYFIR